MGITTHKTTFRRCFFSGSEFWPGGTWLIQWWEKKGVLPQLESGKILGLGVGRKKHSLSTRTQEPGEGRA